MVQVANTSLRSWPLAGLILVNQPFAAVGGAAALWLRGLHLSVSALIGFIALFGVAVVNGLVLLSTVQRERTAGADPCRAAESGARTTPAGAHDSARGEPPVHPGGPVRRARRRSAATSRDGRDQPERSLPGVVILSLSVVVMPVLARAKRRVARALGSAALEADATQTTSAPISP
jgi:divalent metal cation (Fe/Co/Zn/Cd) transporter